MTPDEKTAKGLSPVESLNIFIMKKFQTYTKVESMVPIYPPPSFKNHQCFANFFIYFSLFHLFLFLLLFFFFFFKTGVFSSKPKVSFRQEHFYNWNEKAFVWPRVSLSLDLLQHRKRWYKSQPRDTRVSGRPRRGGAHSSQAVQFVLLSTQGTSWLKLLPPQNWNFSQMLKINYLASS